MAWHGMHNPTRPESVKKETPHQRYAKKERKKMKKNASQNALPRSHAIPPSTYKKIPKRTEKKNEKGPTKQ